MKPYFHPAAGSVTLPEVMQALSDPCRIAIMRCLLEAGELSCGDVPLKISKATRSHHFAVLREAGLIVTRVEGTRCMTSVRRDEMEQRFPGLLELISNETPPRKKPKLALAASLRARVKGGEEKVIGAE